MRKSLKRLQVEAQRDLARALRLAGQMMLDEQLKTPDRLDAMEFIRRCSGLGREKPAARRKTSTFRVLTASEDEARAAAAAAGHSAPEKVPAR